MKKINIALFFYLALSISGATAASLNVKSFSGNWDWANSPSDYTFSLSLTQRKYKLVGQYCAVAHAGRRIDCDTEKNPNISGFIDPRSGVATIQFVSFFGASPGKATIKLAKDHLIWHVTEKPKTGEAYAPMNAVMDRD